MNAPVAITQDVHPDPTAGEEPARRKWNLPAIAGAALAGAALFNWNRARRAEQDHPPHGRIVEIDGVKLNYVTRGEGRPILLLHGNGATIEDWEASGLATMLAETNRIIMVDRPGFGHSSRPRSKIWTAPEQAQLIAGLLERIGVERPLVVGHSFGTQVALALALDHPEHVGGLVLMAGYFYPSPRLDVALAAPAIPVLGDVMRYTVSPLATDAAWPALSRRIFAPAPVSEKFSDFPKELALRPSQIRAQSAEAGLMIPGAASLSKRYGELPSATTIIAGAGDKIVDAAEQSERLHRELPGSRFLPLGGVGHMLHYSATREVANAIRVASD